MSAGIFGQGDNVIEQGEDAWNVFSKPTTTHDYYHWNEFCVKPKHPIQNSELNRKSIPHAHFHQSNISLILLSL